MQDTVDKLYDDITDAIARGSSFRDLHTQLTREGHDVGKGHSSLFAAYKVVKRQRNQQSAASPSSTGAEQNIAAGTAVGELALKSSRHMAAAVIDTRRKIDEW